MGKTEWVTEIISDSNGYKLLMHSGEHTHESRHADGHDERNIIYFNDWIY